jgi:excisionase family DNA binding protein
MDKRKAETNALQDKQRSASSDHEKVDPWPLSYRPAKSRLFTLRGRRLSTERETLGTSGAALLLNAEPSTVERLARSGTLPGVRFGKRWVFHREIVLDFVRNASIAAADGRRKRATTIATPLAVLVERAEKKRRRRVPDLPDFGN